MSTNEMETIQAEYETKEAVKALKDRAASATRLAESLTKYAEQIAKGDDVPSNERFSWAINEIENFVRNVNFAQLARHCARIS